MRRPFARLRPSILRQGSAFVIALVGLCAFVTFLNVQLGAQCGDPGAPFFCHEPYDLAPHAPAGFLKVTTASCEENYVTVSNEDLPIGTYVKQGNEIRPDAKDSVGGKCKLFIAGQYWPPDETRWMVALHMWLTPPSGLQSHIAAYGLTYNQNFDTRIPTTTTFPGTTLGVYNPSDWGNGLGTYAYIFQGQSEATGCNLEQWSDQINKSVNALTCGPNFIRDANGNLHHVPYNGDIEVYTPPEFTELDEAITAAIDDWNTALTGSGVHLHRSETPCSGARCIIVGERPLAVGTCGEVTMPNDPAGGGLTVEPSNLDFTTGNLPTTPGWRSADATRRRQTAAHELGHALGLHHPASGLSCNTNEHSVMRTPDTCHAATSNFTPTINDSLAVRKTLKDGQTMRMCGFPPNPLP